MYAKKNNKEGRILRKNLTKNEFNNIPHIDNLSFVFNNIINENTKPNKKKLYIPKGPRHSKTRKSEVETPKFISNQIKKTKTNNKNVYKNFKYAEYEGKSSQLKLNNALKNYSNFKFKTPNKYSNIKLKKTFSKIRVKCQNKENNFIQNDARFFRDSQRKSEFFDINIKNPFSPFIIFDYQFNIISS